MPQPINIRLMQPSDSSQIHSLESRVQPYRPEDQAAVDAMFERAAAAERDPDRWAPIPQPGQKSGDEAPEDSGYKAFWVAVTAENGQPERVVGMVGVGSMSFHILPRYGPFLDLLHSREDFLELQNLRVDPDFHGRGIGQQLCQTVINWAREQGCHSLFVNTTTPQIPARGLYHKLGFRDVTVTYVGKYELVWMELSL